MIGITWAGAREEGSSQRPVNESGEATAGQVVAELEAYLREAQDELGDRESDPGAPEFCLRWICACAAFPVLRWAVTVALGRAGQADGRPRPPDEGWHLVVGRLAWFRAGRMQKDVRLALLRRLPDRDFPVVRRTLERVLYAALIREGSSARLAPPPRLVGPPRGWSGRSGRCWARRPETRCTTTRSLCWS